MYKIICLRETKFCSHCKRYATMQRLESKTWKRDGHLVCGWECSFCCSVLMDLPREKPATHPEEALG